MATARTTAAAYFSLLRRNACADHSSNPCARVFARGRVNWSLSRDGWGGRPVSRRASRERGSAKRNRLIGSVSGKVRIGDGKVGGRRRIGDFPNAKPFAQFAGGHELGSRRGRRSRSRLRKCG